MYKVLLGGWIRRFGYRRVCIAAHFQTYVTALSQLRTDGMLLSLIGHQHGGFAVPCDDSQLYFDRYYIISLGWAAFARRRFGLNPDVEIIVDRTLPSCDWSTREGNGYFIAVALQDDNYGADFKILKELWRVRELTGVDLVIYPHPRCPKRYLRRLKHFGHVETDERFINAKLLLTRYSTMGIEFAEQGGCSLFVDFGVRLAYENLNSRAIATCKLEDLSREVIRVLGGGCLGVRGAC